MPVHTLRQTDLSGFAVGPGPGLPGLGLPGLPDIGLPGGRHLGEQAASVGGRKTLPRCVRERLQDFQSGTLGCEPPANTHQKALLIENHFTHASFTT